MSAPPPCTGGKWEGYGLCRWHGLKKQMRSTEASMVLDQALSAPTAGHGRCCLLTGEGPNFLRAGELGHSGTTPTPRSWCERNVSVVAPFDPESTVAQRRRLQLAAHPQAHMPPTENSVAEPRTRATRAASDGRQSRRD